MEDLPSRQGSEVEDKTRRESHGEQIQETLIERRENAGLVQQLPDDLLPRGKGWWHQHLVQYQGFWLPPSSTRMALSLMQHFRPRGDDIILATSPKCGTTWVRALIFATINRHSHDLDSDSHPLLAQNPQDLVPFLEGTIFNLDNSSDVLEAMASPRFLSTHMPYTLFPDPMIKSSTATTCNCKFVYVCRDPKDAFVSKWHFTNKMRPKELPPLSLEEAFQLFSQGVSNYGPFWDHVLSYWKASRERPDHVMVLTYEDLKRNPTVHVKRMARFLGVPFTSEEEGRGAVDRVVKLCSFENLSNLEVNKRVTESRYVKNPYFFRKGEVGDWKNHLTPAMAAQIDEITEDKFGGCRLDLFACNPQS